MAGLFDLRFVFVVGKGGVGKTTAAAALALAAQKRGKRVLLAMCNSKERLSHLLEVPPIGATNVEVLRSPNGGVLDAVNMVPKVALEEYGLMILRSRTLYKAVFENSMVAAVLRGTPGIEAWSMLGKAYFHTKDELADGRRRYDMVIVDAPATGHGLEMLRVPKVITDVAPPGLLRREAEDAVALFRDPKRAGCMVVTLAEDMPVQETIELAGTLDRELQLPVAQLVVNQVLPRLFPPSDRDAVLALASAVQDAAEGTSSIRGLALAGRTRTLRERVQEESLARLNAELGRLPRTNFPMLFSPEFKRAQVESLAATLDASIGHSSEAVRR
jgi:anion-transporting  ArsA/GET3 family ATPase